MKASKAKFHSIFISIQLSEMIGSLRVTIRSIIARINPWHRICFQANPKCQLHLVLKHGRLYITGKCIYFFEYQRPISHPRLSNQPVIKLVYAFQVPRRYISLCPLSQVTKNCCQFSKITSGHQLKITHKI